MKRFARLAVFGILVFIVAFIIGACYLTANYLVHPPRTYATRTPADVGMTTYQDVTLTTADGLRLDSWYIPPTREDGATILFVHGHAGNRGHFLPQAQFFAPMGYGLFMVE